MALQSGAGAGGGKTATGIEADALKPGTLLQKRYKIVSVSNFGRNFIAYLAEDGNTSATVTIKGLRCTPAEAEKAEQQFKQEYQSLKGLSHPALPRLMALFEEDGKHYMVLERVDARTLQDVIENDGGPAPMTQVLTWLSELLDVLEYLHGQDPPIIHRDLQPSTIMITPDGHLKLLDFGIAKIAERRDSRTLYSSAGNPAYAPMDQFSLKRSDPRMDLFSAGASFYFALSGEAPPPAAERVLKALPLLDLRTVNPSVSEKMNSLIQQMMAIKASDRPKDADAVRKIIGLATPPPRPRSGELDKTPSAELRASASAAAASPLPVVPPVAAVSPPVAPPPVAVPPPNAAPARMEVPPPSAPPPPLPVPRPVAPTPVPAASMPKAVAVTARAEPAPPAAEADEEPASPRRGLVGALIIFLLFIVGAGLTVFYLRTNAEYPVDVRDAIVNWDWIGAWQASGRLADAGNASADDARHVLSALLFCGLGGLVSLFFVAGAAVTARRDHPADSHEF